MFRTGVPIYAHDQTNKSTKEMLSRQRSRTSRRLSPVVWANRVCIDKQFIVGASREYGTERAFFTSADRIVHILHTGRDLL